jgi:hypothetical protein
MDLTIRIAIVAALFAIVASLGSGLFYLIRDRTRSSCVSGCPSHCSS